MSMLFSGGLNPPQRRWYRRWPRDAAGLVLRRKGEWIAVVLASLLAFWMGNRFLKDAYPPGLAVLGAISLAARPFLFAGVLALVSGADGRPVGFLHLLKTSRIFLFVCLWDTAEGLVRTVWYLLLAGAAWRHDFAWHAAHAGQDVILDVARREWCFLWSYWEDGPLGAMVAVLVVFQALGGRVSGLLQTVLVFFGLRRRFRRQAFRANPRPETGRLKTWKELADFIDRLPGRSAAWLSFIVVVLVESVAEMLNVRLRKDCRRRTMTGFSSCRLWRPDWHGSFVVPVCLFVSLMRGWLDSGVCALAFDIHGSSWWGPMT